jgi:hypothetical protein
MSGPKKYLRTESGERIDQPDFEHAAEESQLAGLTQLGETFIVGSDAGQKNYVLSGFKVTNPSANNLEISIGSGILSWKDQGNVEHGVMIDMTTARTVGLSTTLAGAGATTYGVYVSFNLQDAQQENRNFWNALAATPVEVTRQIATRRVDSLEVNIKASSPGTEWMHIADIVPGSLTAPGVGSTTGITDKRVFYFEGAVVNTYSPDNDWGDGTNDRNADRSTYGIKGLRTFVRAIQRQLKDIIGASSGNWFSSVPSSITSLHNDKLSRSGLNTISGNIIPDGDGTREFGSPAAAFESLHATRFAFPSDTRAYNTYGAISYRWIDVAAANISDTYGDGPPQHVSRRTYDPTSISNPARIDVSASLASDAYIYFPIDLPGKYFANDYVSKTSAVYLDKVEVHLTNNSVNATKGMVMRQDLSTAAMDTLHSGTGGLNWYSFPSTTGGNIGTASQLSTIDQNQAIDNSAYRYFVVIQAKASFQTFLYGVKLTYTVHNLIT